VPVSKADTVRAVFDAYLRQIVIPRTGCSPRTSLFTSPQDDHIDKATFFERCFPTADRVTSQEMIYIVPVGGDDVFAMYGGRVSPGG
jgi:hypothetical protein